MRSLIKTLSFAISLLTLVASVSFAAGSEGQNCPKFGSKEAEDLILNNASSVINDGAKPEGCFAILVEDEKKVLRANQIEATDSIAASSLASAAWKAMVLDIEAGKD